MERMGKYQLVRKLAVGGMAEVFLARSEGAMGFSKTLVVKRILPHFSDDPTFTAMFLGEAKMAAELNHPNLVQVFDFGQAEDRLFLAMEFIDGPNLRQLNLASRQRGMPLPLEVCARLVSLAAEGLHYAHEMLDVETGQPAGVVHRDISPDNILLSRSGAVKVVDFGIAKSTSQVHLTQSGVIKGKIAYMPPEQLARKPLDRRVDIYALGVVLYELTSGRMPFDSSSEVSIIQAVMSEMPFEAVSVRRPDTPPELEHIISKCLDKNRDTRYHTARALQQDLERFISGSGKQVSASDLADIVTALALPPLGEFSQKIPAPATGDFSISGTHKRPAPTTDAGGEDPFGKTDISGAHKMDSKLGTPSVVSPMPSAVTAPASSKAPIFIALGMLAVGAAAAIYFVKDRGGTGGTVLVDPPPVVAVVDAGASNLVIAPVPVEPLAPVDAGSGTTVLAPDVEDAGVAAVLVKVRNGKVDFRIRPYAEVFIDGKKVGDTPFPPLTLTTGHHKLRVVNEKLNKDLAIDLNVKPGENVFKLNLKE